MLTCLDIPLLMLTCLDIPLFMLTWKSLSVNYFSRQTQVNMKFVTKLTWHVQNSWMHVYYMFTCHMNNLNIGHLYLYKGQTRMLTWNWWKLSHLSYQSTWMILLWPCVPSRAGPRVVCAVIEQSRFVFSIKLSSSPAFRSLLRARATLTHAHDPLVIWSIMD